MTHQLYTLTAPDLLRLNAPAFADVLRRLEKNMIDFRELVEHCHSQPTSVWDYPGIITEAKRLLRITSVVHDALTLSYSRFTDVEIVGIDDVMIRVKGRKIDISVLLRWLEEFVMV